jgi:hypothetical protein
MALPLISVTRVPVCTVTPRRPSPARRGLTTAGVKWQDAIAGLSSTILAMAINVAELA